MRKGRITVVKGIVVLTLVMGAIAFTGFCAEAASAGEPIVLKAVTHHPTGHDSTKSFLMYADMLKEASKGRLIIKRVGGPEAIPSKMLPQAVRTGSIDLAQAVAAGYEDLVAEGILFSLSELTPTEERTSRFYDFIVEMHKKVNLFYLGRVRAKTPFFLWSNVKVKTPRELAGLKFRSHAFYLPFFKALGIAGVSMKLGDVYAALDRGLVQGWACSPATALKRALYEVTKYVINHGFYMANNSVLIMNLDKWNSLPKESQDLMTEVMVKYEPKMAAWNFDKTMKAMEKVVKAGVKPIEFSPADAKWYLDTAYRAKWEHAKNKIKPESYARAKALLSK